MSTRTSLLLVLPLALALALGACGKYSQVGQKLDVAQRIPSGQTWVAATPGNRGVIRVLLLGDPANGASTFAFSSIDTYATAGVQLQGSWVELAGTVTASVVHTWSLSGTSVSGQGSVRDDNPRTIVASADRSIPGTLVISGSADLAGTYRPLVEQLQSLTTADARAAQCAYQLSSLAIQASEIRTIGFGGAGMTQYTRAEDYIGIMAGRVNVSTVLHGVTGALVTNTFYGFQDFAGLQIDGPQSTDSSLSGNGQMSGVLTLTYNPESASTVVATLDYSHIEIRGGTTGGGYYLMSIVDWADPSVVVTTATLDPLNMPTLGESTSVPSCLALP